MASYQSFITHISQGDIMSAYSGVLTDINYCLNLLEDLEIGRTYTERGIDWLQEDRANISDNLKQDLRDLKKEIETGIGVYTDLFFKLNSFKVLKNIYEPRLDALSYSPDGKSNRFGFLQVLKTQFDDFKNEIDQQKPPKTTPQENTDIRWSSYAWSCASSVGKSLANWYDPSTYEGRSSKYKKVKSLHEALNKAEILKIFEENHRTVRDMVKEIELAAINLNSQPTENPTSQPNTADNN